MTVSACNSNKQPKQVLAAYIDLGRFMGTWYVHGHSPTFMDKQAFAATETYELGEDGKILTTYSYRKGSLDGKLKSYHPVGKVHNHETNSEWRMRFFGILNAPYYILYVDDDYQYTVVGHPSRKMAWIMSRSAEIDPTSYEALRSELVSREYELKDFRRIPH